MRRGFSVAAILVVITAVATATSIIWPIEGDSIQAGFFLSLTSALLTLFGLVFTLCLIGTQLIAGRTYSTLTRIFGPATWFYLTLFLATTLWTLLISYHAGNAHASHRLCLEHKICVSEAIAGRLSVFGLTWSLLLLLPFTYYIYWRFSEARTFGSFVTAALRARNGDVLAERTRRFRHEILSLLPDLNAVNLGLDHLLELGVIGARRSKPRKTVTAYEVAACVTNELGYLNNELLTNKGVSKVVQQRLNEWSTWLILHNRNAESASPHAIEGQDAGQLTRHVVEIATGNIRRWQYSADSSINVYESVRIVEQIANIRLSAAVRVRISLAARALSECIEIKATESPQSSFNFALRSLIRLCESVTGDERWAPDGIVVLKELIRALAILGNMDERVSIPFWVMWELHNLTDLISTKSYVAPKLLENYLDSACSLRSTEVLPWIAGASDPKRHTTPDPRHYMWQSRALRSLHDAQRSDRAVLARSAQGIAIKQWAKDGDLEYLVTLLEGTSSAYLYSAETEVESTLRVLLDATRTSFWSTLKTSKPLDDSRWIRPLRSLATGELDRD